MRYEADFLVIGSGIAGLTYAIHAARAGSVIIATKKNDSESNTNYAQGGVACVLDPNDSFDAHVNDTLVAGAGLCDRKAVEILVHEGPDRIRELVEWGAHFTTAKDSHAFGSLDLGREGGHTANRIVHARDLTGREIEHALLSQVRNNPRITILEDHCLVELITDHHLTGTPVSTTCYGAYIFDRTTKQVHAIRADVTMLATGGAGQVYKHTTNPMIATGDGLAAAWRAGAQVRNMEFFQFHPTSLYHPEGKSFLISEALRGHGAVLKNRAEKEFMDDYHPMKSLAPRDIVARAIDREMKQSGEPCVFLDIRHANADDTRKRFPTIFARCKELGIDITKDLIPVVPAAHYLCGGVTVDINGRTTIDNLYACGEVSATGIHGANRLASNSLLEALVFARRAADDAAPRIKAIHRVPAKAIPDWDDSGTIDAEEWVLIAHNFREVKDVMWDYVGIVRSNLRLQRAKRRIRLIAEETEDFYRRTRITAGLLQLRNLITVAQLIIESALKRHESRGLHYTTDFPERDDSKKPKDTVLRKRVVDRKE